MLRSPSNPWPLAPLPEHRTTGGAARGAAPGPRTGARTAQRRTAVVAADLTQPEQVIFDQAAEALRLPNAGEPAYEAVSGIRELSPDLPRRPHRGPRRLRRFC
ncbi:MAG: hypothetical protein OXE58_15925 [Acidobacteria bacterium]|nr:hypothetical protein [Acidobacteriota bacterium]